MIPLVLLALGILLRVIVVGHGLPDINEEATPVRQAWEMWDWETGSIDLNPAFFNYPALSFYIHWLAQAAYRIVTEPLGLGNWGPSETPPLDLILLGRVLTLAFSIGIGIATYHLGRSLIPAYWAAWAGVSLLFMPTLFHYSVLSIVDLPLTFFTIIALSIRPSPKQLKTHLWAGLLVGLAASCKYTGLFLAVPYTLSHLASHRWCVLTAMKSSYPWIAGVTTIVTFFAINPFIILDYDTFYWHYAFERHHMAGGHFGRTHSAVSEYGGALWYNIGLILIPAAILGGAAAWKSTRNDIWIPLIGFTLLYPGFLLVWSTSFGHYLFPVFPVLALLAIQGIRLTSAAMRDRISYRALRTGLPILALLPLSIPLVSEFQNFRTPAPRTLARQWIADTIPAGSLIAKEAWGPQIGENQHEVLIPMHSTDPTQSSPVYSPGWYAPFDAFVVVEGVESRYRSQPEAFPDQLNMYDHLEAEWALWKRFGQEGKGIRVYRNTDPNRATYKSYPDSLYARLGKMSRTLAGRFLDRLGGAYRDGGRLLFSGDVYNRLIQNVPDEQDYTLAYADVLLSLKRRDLAIRLLESRRDSGDDHLVASLHFLKADYDSATAAWMRFADAHPGNVRVRVSLARILVTMGRESEALDWYVAATVADVDEVEPWLQACRLSAKLGRTDLTKRIASQALKKWPDNAEFGQWSP